MNSSNETTVEEVVPATEVNIDERIKFIGILHEDRDEILFTDEKEEYRLMMCDFQGNDFAATTFPDTSGADIYEKINQFIRGFESNQDVPVEDRVFEYRILRPRTQDIFVIKRINPDPTKEYKCSVCLDTFQNNPKYIKYKKLKNCPHKIHRYCNDFWKGVCKDLQLQWSSCPKCKENEYNFVRYTAFVKR